jgi:hypothetical protein
MTRGIPTALLKSDVTAISNDHSFTGNADLDSWLKWLGSSELFALPGAMQAS